jgi:hypothetical protein
MTAMALASYGPFRLLVAFEWRREGPALLLGREG